MQKVLTAQIKKEIYILLEIFGLFLEEQEGYRKKDEKNYLTITKIVYHPENKPEKCRHSTD